MQIIDRYIARNFLNGVAIVLFILVPLFGFLILSEELEDAGKGAFTSFDALLVVGYSLPRLMLDLLPVSALLGVLIGLGAMANHQELIIVNSFGYSARRIAWPVVKATVGIIVVVLLIQFFVVPKFELSAARVRAKATPQTTIASIDSEVWTRSGKRFIRIGQVSEHGALRNVEIFELGENGALQELMQASDVEVLSDGQWLLRDVSVTEFGPAAVKEQRLESMMWQSSLSAQQTSGLIVPVEAMAPSDLYRYIRLLEANNLDTHRYRVVFWQQLSIPVGLLAMSLLGLPFLVGSVRSVPAGQRAALGGSVGILFYLSEQMTGHLATLYEISPAPSALAPDIALLVLALVLLHRLS
ncbi:MAG: LPS export ABC transporter permease LptG [Gammaproteobacteria bacterium]|nr:MAG: LPS export ABC transporter permease LptG [Gammaproteobacteria bacterium]